MSECQATTKNGRACGAAALRGEDYCYIHSPSREAQRRASRQLGGKRRAYHAGAPDILPGKVRTIEGVLEVLDYTLSEASTLNNGVPRVRSLIALAGAYLEALEAGEMEERLSKLEEALNVNKK